MGRFVSLATRLAVAFALVAGVVAALVGVLSYDAAADRISQEVNQTLQAVTTSLASGQTAVLSRPSRSARVNAAVTADRVGRGSRWSRRPC